MTMTFEKTSTESDDFFGDRVEAKEIVLLIICVQSQGEISHGLSALALHEFGKVANSMSLISYESLVPRRIDLR